MPSMSQLRGLSMRWASLMGMPHVGAKYDSYRTGSYSLDDDARCAICGYGGHPLNAHHLVNRGVCHEFELDGHRLRSPLWCLHGSGTTGCHGAVHDRNIIITWEWDDQSLEDAWWSGDILRAVRPHSDELWAMGRYVIDAPQGRISLRDGRYELI